MLVYFILFCVFFVMFLRADENGRERRGKTFVLKEKENYVFDFSIILLFFVKKSVRKIDIRMRFQILLFLSF